MIRGLYTAGWGMITQQNYMDVITNNLANANTDGYKKDGVIVKSFEEAMAQHIQRDPNKTMTIPVGNMSLGANVTEIFTDFSQGVPQETGNGLDVLIQGQGFFAVRGQDGTVRFTRSGAFQWDGAGNLITGNGEFVLDKNNKPITMDQFPKDAQGNPNVSPLLMDKLGVYNFTNNNTLKKVGNNLYEMTDTTKLDPSFQPVLIQGMIEKSNVNAVDEMVNMITVMRAYETNSKAVKAQDELLAKTVNEVGKL